jgi:hypothetical protein
MTISIYSMNFIHFIMETGFPVYILDLSIKDFYTVVGVQ